MAWGAPGPGLAAPCPLGHQEQPCTGAPKRPAFELWPRLKIGLVSHQGASCHSDAPRANRLRPRPPEAVALLQETPGRAAPGLKVGSSGRAAEAPGAGTLPLCPRVLAHGLPRVASGELQASPCLPRSPPEISRRGCIQPGSPSRLCPAVQSKNGHRKRRRVSGGHHARPRPALQAGEEPISSESWGQEEGWPWPSQARSEFCPEVTGAA